jgi:hypothetical protein
MLEIDTRKNYKEVIKIMKNAINSVEVRIGDGLNLCLKN